MFDVLDQLVGPLSAHITSLLSQPISGTDDERSQIDTKKAYLALLNSIMSAKLEGIFTSESELLIYLSFVSFSGLLLRKFPWF
jgi:exportin-T